MASEGYYDFFFLFQVVKLGEFSIDFLGKHVRIYFAMEKTLSRILVASMMTWNIFF